MGGQSIIAQGIAANMLPLNQMSLDRDGLLRVGAGACWAQVLPFLDQQGLSVAVMQSNNTFSVGGSLSANAHGWQHNRPPIAGSVAWLRLMLADGTVRLCSRTQERELFRLALGGYGLAGVILEAGLHVVPNQRYRAAPSTFPAEEYTARHAALVDGRADVGMAYGRLDVTPDSFLRTASLTVFTAEPDGRHPDAACAGAGWPAAHRLSRLGGQRLRQSAALGVGAGVRDPLGGAARLAQPAAQRGGRGLCQS
jgi:FAD/FMN-containing dehydrogenase